MRYSLRTLIVVMLLGGPLLACGYWLSFVLDHHEAGSVIGACLFALGMWLGHVFDNAKPRAGG